MLVGALDSLGEKFTHRQSNKEQYLLERKEYARNPTNVHAIVYMAVYQMEEGNLPEAVNLANKALNLDKTILEAINILGICAIKTGDSLLAVKYFRQLTAARPTNDVYVYNLYYPWTSY